MNYITDISFCTSNNTENKLKTVVEPDVQLQIGPIGPAAIPEFLMIPQKSWKNVWA